MGGLVGRHLLTRRAFLGLAAGAAAAAGLAGCTSDLSQPQTTDEKSVMANSDAAAGQIGGTLTIYTPNTNALVKKVAPAFEDATGIRVELVQAGTGDIFRKLAAEKDHPVADVAWGGSYARFWGNRDLFQSYVSTSDAEVPEAYRNTTGFYTPYGIDGSVILLNKTLTAGMDIKGYADLLDGRLAGKISSADPATSSSAFAQLTNMLKAMGGYESDDAWNYVKSLYTLVQGKIASSSSKVYTSVSQGDVAVGLSYEDPCVQLLSQGADVEVVYPEEGCVFLPASTAIVADCPHLVQAKAWVDYLVSFDGQSLIASGTTLRPVRDDVALGASMRPLDQIDVIQEDFDYVCNHANDIVTRYATITESMEAVL